MDIIKTKTENKAQFNQAFLNAYRFMTKIFHRK